MSAAGRTVGAARVPGRGPGTVRLLLLALLAALLAPPVAALAHDSGSYYDVHWFTDPAGVTGDVGLDWAFSPTFEDDARDAALAAADAWNLAGAGLSFTPVGSVGSDPGPSDCGLNLVDDVHVLRRGEIDGPASEGGGILAITALCFLPLGAVAHHFTITYDETEPYWFDDGIPTPDQFDLQGILAHEFGHATGWGRHFDETTGTECLLAQRHTMCSTVAPGTIDPRSLEEHDVDTFRDAY